MRARRSRRPNTWPESIHRGERYTECSPPSASMRVHVQPFSALAAPRRLVFRIGAYCRTVELGARSGSVPLSPLLSGFWNHYLEGTYHQSEYDADHRGWLPPIECSPAGVGYGIQAWFAGRGRSGRTGRRGAPGSKAHLIQVSREGGIIYLRGHATNARAWKQPRAAADTACRRLLMS